MERFDYTMENGVREGRVKGKPSTASATFNITVIYDGLLRLKAEDRRTKNKDTNR